MLRVVLPVAASASWQSRRAISAANPARTTYATNSSSTADSTDTTNAAGSARAADSTGTADSADSTGATNSSRTADSTDPTNAASPPDVAAVAAANVRIAIEIIVVIDVDVIVSTPPAAPTPAPAPERSHRHSNAEGDRHPRRVITGWRIVDRRVGIERCSPNYIGIVRRDVNNLGIGLLDHNHTLTFEGFRFYFLLFGRLQISLVVGLLAHALDGIHHVTLLREESIA